MNRVQYTAYTDRSASVIYSSNIVIYSEYAGVRLANLELQK